MKIITGQTAHDAAFHAAQAIAATQICAAADAIKADEIGEALSVIGKPGRARKAPQGSSSLYPLGQPRTAAPAADGGDAGQDNPPPAPPGGGNGGEGIPAFLRRAAPKAAAEPAADAEVVSIGEVGGVEQFTTTAGIESAEPMPSPEQIAAMEAAPASPEDGPAAPKAKAKKRAPDHDEIASAIRDAATFTVSVFLGVGQFAKEQAASLAEARAAGDRLIAEHKSTRKAMVYAMSATGRQTFIPPAFEETDDMPAKTTKPAKTAAPKGGKKAAKPRKAEALPKTTGSRRKDAARTPVAAPATKAAKPASAPAGERMRASTAALYEAAGRGKMPSPPDFSAETHKRFRGKLDQVVALAKAGDIKALKAFEINPVSSSPKAIARYRDLCVIALEARAKG